MLKREIQEGLKNTKILLWNNDQKFPEFILAEIIMRKDPLEVSRGTAKEQYREWALTRAGRQTPYD